jgi:ATP-dependent RNA circularization protein (DNA/RNA ligase family)
MLGRMAIVNKFKQLEEITDCTRKQFAEILEIDLNHAKPITLEGIEGLWSKSRGPTMGTVMLKTAPPLVFRGYPKIKYAEDKIYGAFRSSFLQTRISEDDVLFAEEKMDGTNLALLYDSRIPITCCGVDKFWVKTRLSLVAEEWEGNKWQEKLSRTPSFNKVVEAVKSDHYIVYVELYGWDNPGDFIAYPDIEIAIKVLDLVDKNTMEMVYRKEKEEFCRKWDLPITDITHKLTPYMNPYTLRDTLQTMEDEMDEINRDGIKVEGYMMKLNCGYLGEQILGKVKGESIQRMIRGLSAKSRYITKNTLRRSFLNARRDLGYTIFYNSANWDEIKQYVIEDLLEDFEQEKVDKVNDDMITSQYDLMKETMEMDNQIVNILQGWKSEGYNLNKVPLIMSMLADKYPALRQQGSKLYHKYQIAKSIVQDNN